MITGPQIAAHRKAQKISRKAMAEKTGLTEGRIANLEKGSAPKGGELELLVEHYPEIANQAAPPPSTGNVPSPEPAAPEEQQPASEEQATANGSAEPVVTLDEDEVEGDEVVVIDGEDGDGLADVLPFQPISNGEPSAEEAAGSDTECITPGAEPYSDHIVDFTDRADGLRRISNGELQTIKRCKRKWFLGYYRKLGLPEESPLGARAIGTRVHYALASWYVPDGQDRADPFEVLEATIQEDIVALSDNPLKLAQLTKEADLCRAMLEGYFQWLAETGADEGLRIVAPETKLEVDPQIPGVRLIAKIDVRAVREQTGARLFIDHKTVGDLTTPTKMLPMDEQMMHYHLCEYLDLLASGQHDLATEGALYNMLRKVKRTAQATPPFYDRVEVRHNVETLRSYWLRVQGTVMQIQQTEAMLDQGWDHRIAAPPTPRKECTWDCDFFHVCLMFDDGSRAEDFVASQYVTINPLKRYETTDRVHEA